MIENLLKPIKWFDFDDIHGNKTSTTATIICEYDVEASESGYEVNYYNEADLSEFEKAAEQRWQEFTGGAK